MKKLSAREDTRYRSLETYRAKYGLLGWNHPAIVSLTPREFVEESGDSSPNTQNDTPAAVWSH
jgi:hypothetical protein